MKEKILSIIYKFPKINQKRIGIKLKISESKTSYLLRKLIKNDLIIKEKIGNNNNFKLTSLGKTTLNNYEIKSKTDTAIIYPNLTNYNSELFLINNKKIIERNIELLLENGIKRIIVFSNGNKYNYLGEIYKGVEIENCIFNNVGTYKLIFDFFNKIVDINENLLFLREDLIFAERAIKNILSSEKKEILLFSKELKYKDLFIGFSDDNANQIKISKNIEELENLYGELIGIYKFSKDFIKFIQSNRIKNELYSFESSIVKYFISSKNKPSLLSIDSLVWAKIYNFKEKEEFEKNYLKRLEKVDDYSSIEDIRKILLDEILLKVEDIDNVESIGGMTNKNFLVVINSEKYVIRNPGSGTDKLINRENEFRNIKKVTALSIDSELVYFNPKNGIKMSKYIEDSETLSPVTVKKNFKLIAQTLKSLHSSQDYFQNEFNIFKEIKKYEAKIKGEIEKFYPNYSEIKKKIKIIENKLENDSLKKVNCHNDTVAENFIKSNDKIFLIDWEYSGLNEAEWDLAAFSLESSLSSEEEKIFLSYYYENKINKKNIEKILIYKILQDFLWSLWTIVKFENGVDFGSYGLDRYNRCVENLKGLNYV